MGKLIYYLPRGLGDYYVWATVGVTDSPMPCHITRGTGPAVAACVATKHASRNMANIVRLFAASKL